MYLVYPDFALSPEVTALIRDVNPQLVYQKAGSAFDQTHLVDVPRIVADNDLRALAYVAALLGSVCGVSPPIRNDGEAVKHPLDSFVSFGLSSNDCTHMYLQRSDDPCFRILPDEMGSEFLEVRDKEGHWKPARSAERGYYYGLIVKFRPDPEEAPEQCCFLCAGLGPNGTSGAAWFLANRWRRLHKQVGKNAFTALVRVPHYSDSDTVLESVTPQGCNGLRKFLDELVSRLQSSSGTTRCLVGITGPPAAGKSTVSKQLASDLNEEMDQNVAVEVSMDGFHLPNEILQELGLRQVKGAPETFDAQGFVALLQQLRQEANQLVSWPAYDRVKHETVPAAVKVLPGHRIVFVDGNYLLLSKPPWNQVAGLIDLVLYLDVPRALIVQRLLARHHAGGMSTKAAARKVHASDLANAALVEHSKNAAGWILLWNPKCSGWELRSQ
jgi:pantothenate kinase